MSQPTGKIELCQNCHKRKATQNWVGTGDVLGFIHGSYERWCERCCVEAQLKFAKQHKNDIQKLERKLKNL